MEQTLQLILDKLNSMDQRFVAMEQRFDAMDKRFDAMEKRIDEMDERLSGEQKRQGDFLHHLINAVAATDVKITQTNKKLDALESKVESVVVEVKEIKNSMAIKHDLKYYDQMISEHSREIHKLKNH
ncbi:hypothetical protein [Neobacillus sp. D3-1R]|uniref:hypothetical protein n=1 Tax=Neobacillus sp. D3-1R TaxID=3445778 RepID=UPI003F9F46CA